MPPRDPLDSAPRKIAAFAIDGYDPEESWDDLGATDAKRAAGTVASRADPEAPIEWAYALSIAATSDDEDVRQYARAMIQEASENTVRFFCHNGFDDHDEVIPRLTDDVTSDDPYLRAGAVCSVRWILSSGFVDGMGSMFPKLVEALSSDTDLIRRGAAASTLALLHDDYTIDAGGCPESLEFAEPLAAAVRSPDPRTRGHAAAALATHVGRLPDTADEAPEDARIAVGTLVDALRVEDTGMRRTILRWLDYVDTLALREETPAATPDRFATRTLAGVTDCLRSSSPIVRERASQCLDSNADLFATPSDDQREQFAEQTGRLVTAIVGLSPDPAVDRTVARTLGELAAQHPEVARGAVVAAERTLADSTASVWARRDALVGLERLAETAPTGERDLPVGAVVASLTDPSKRVRRQAGSVLETAAREDPEMLGDHEPIGRILLDHWSAPSEDASRPDPLVVVAGADPDRACELGDRLLSATTEDRSTRTLDLLREMAAVAPEAIKPLVERARERFYH